MTTPPKPTPTLAEMALETLASEARRYFTPSAYAITRNHSYEVVLELATRAESLAREVEEARRERPIHDQVNAHRLELVTEVEQLRRILVATVEAIGNRSFASNNSSLQFLAHVPEEVAKYTDHLRAQLASLTKLVAEVRALELALMNDDEDGAEAHMMAAFALLTPPHDEGTGER